MKPFTLWSGMALIAAVASGCSKQEQAQTERNLKQAGKTTLSVAKKAGKATVKTLDTAAEKTTDAAITGSVKTQLLADKWVGASGIDVTTRNHVVTLNGKVPSTAQRARAGRIAMDVVGVRGVKNALKVGK